MEINLEEDSSMAKKILFDIQHIIWNDSNLMEFSIVPVVENKNKSPVLYEEHSLGLESWCIKHVYRYVYNELFKARPLLKKNRLLQDKIKKIDTLLIGALLIHPEVTTFWNMRRELVQYGEINADNELLLTKLVLSHKNKCNVAFAYRRWILMRLIKGINKERINFAIALLEEEFSVTQMAAQKAQNNYHAWNHRIWCIENMVKKTAIIESREYLSVILSQLDFSSKWINRHVSEHSGYQYRQYICNSILDNTIESDSHIQIYQKYQLIFAHYVDKDIMQYKNIAYLDKLLGVRNCTKRNNPKDMIRCYNYSYYFIILLSDLVFFIRKLNKMYPNHESMWYYRRFIVYHLIKVAFDYHGLPWKRTVGLNDVYTANSKDFEDSNIVTSNLDSIEPRGREGCIKILKYELSAVKSSFLYSCIAQDETLFMSENATDFCNGHQFELAQKYARWSKFILGFEKV